MCYSKQIAEGVTCLLFSPQNNDNRGNNHTHSIAVPGRAGRRVIVATV